MKFAVIGGDMRLAKLAEMLSADGHETAVFALEKIHLREDIRQCETAREAAAGAGCVILPMPLQAREGILSGTLSNGTHTVREALSAAEPGQIVCAGRVEPSSADTAASLGIEIIDYFKREELAVCNAVAAAEGALQLMMEETPTTLWDSRALVIGFGRIGKILAHRLRGLGARVTAAARTPADLAWIRALGYDAAETPRLDGLLSGFDFIVNTVPARVLWEKRLREIPADCLCLDLASKPGGIDFGAASRLGIKAVWALSLPGEVAPVTSGKIIRDTVYNILREKGALS